MGNVGVTMKEASGTELVSIGEMDLPIYTLKKFTLPRLESTDAGLTLKLHPPEIPCSTSQLSVSSRIH